MYDTASRISFMFGSGEISEIYRRYTDTDIGFFLRAAESIGPLQLFTKVHVDYIITSYGKF